MEGVDITDRFAELARGPEARCRLDVGAILIAAHAHPDLDVDEQLARLDDLPPAAPGGRRRRRPRHVFDVLDFRGDTDDYANPANSLIDVVLDRRRGIPITLSVVVIEVGRRVGVPLEGWACPATSWCRQRRRAPLRRPVPPEPARPGGCEGLFAKVHGPPARFEDRFLAPVGPRAILARMLTNLQRSFVGQGDRAGALWAQCLGCSSRGPP